MDDTDIKVDQRIRSFSYISDLFKYVEGFNMMGHKIGRKVGDMLELVVMAKIHADDELAKRVIYEPKMVGATGAGHKVEFGFYENESALKNNRPFGFIECKKVGVEVTKDSSTRNALKDLKVGENITLAFTRKWLDKPINFDLKVVSINDSDVLVEINATGRDKYTLKATSGSSIKLVVTEDGLLHIMGPEENLRDIQGIVRICKYINLEKVSETNCGWSLYDCLTGPQTIEKAKQASLVAMDIRKLVDGKWGRDDLSESEKTTISVLVLTEASHWEQKSRKVITTCIDHNIIVPDEIIVEAFKMFESEFGLTDMLDLIRKSEYVLNERVRNTLETLLAKFENKLFYDLNLETYVDIFYDNGKLAVKEITSS